MSAVAKGYSYGAFETVTRENHCCHLISSNSRIITIIIVIIIDSGTEALENNGC